MKLRKGQITWNWPWYIMELKYNYHRDDNNSLVRIPATKQTVALGYTMAHSRYVLLRPTVSSFMHHVTITNKCVINCIAIIPNRALCQYLWHINHLYVITCGIHSLNMLLIVVLWRSFINCQHILFAETLILTHPSPTPIPLVPHICVSEPGENWFRKWLGAE